ncbi:MAG: D-alanyl-D-alanine dipeptidase [Synechococcales cyanobacterium CRU_2_2]|nr:D-alanyl-D-alanine dipeptidase [Synechococcales cyanobacterium CRU_2_2]
MLKPYQTIPIQDCGEPLVAIPLDVFERVDPHPYLAVGAPYGDRSPFFVRQGILTRLHQAQQNLQRSQPDWRIQIFDAYRPVAVQRYMVNYTFEQERLAQGLGAKLTPESETELWTQVHTFWAIPSDDPATPPPHSTGAAVDVTLINQLGQVIDMGSPIDAISERSYPNYFASQASVSRTAEQVLEAQRFHQHREILRLTMESAGFLRHPREWWHFSFGDQVWVWLEQGGVPEMKAEWPAGAIARYGLVP